jgi:hypothetical protein
MCKCYLRRVLKAVVCGVKPFSAHLNLRTEIRERNEEQLITYWKNLHEPKAVHCSLRLFPTHLRSHDNPNSHRHVQDSVQFLKVRLAERSVMTYRSACVLTVAGSEQNHADHQDERVVYPHIPLVDMPEED